MSKDGLRVQYRVRKTIRTLSSPANIIKPPPAPTHTKRGRELRPKVQSVYNYETEPDLPLVPRVIEAWCAEVWCLTVCIGFCSVRAKTTATYPRVMKKGLNNVLLSSLFNVVNNIVTI